MKVLVEHSLQPTESRGGIVTATDPRAAAAGRRILAAGGNAFDAAVATAFAVGVVEPFMSGVGGGMWLVGHHAATGTDVTVDAPMRAPSAARPDMYRLDRSAAASGLYGWPGVQGDENVVGARSVAVPGAVAGYEAALAYGRLSLAQVLEPAIELAFEGVACNWFMSSCVVSEMERLRADEMASRIFLPDGIPLRSEVTGPADVLRQEALGRTLQRIARNGAAEVYEGATGRALLRCVGERGGLLSERDLSGYAARVDTDPARWRCGDIEVVGPVATGVGTVVQALKMVAMLDAERPAEDAAERGVRWALSLRAAMRFRLARMTAEPRSPESWERWLDDETIARILEGNGAGTPLSGSRAGCTTHLTVADGEGNVVSLTQTVLDLFGSRVIDAQSGILLNDGMMYFDPRPGRPNSVEAGAAGLSAVAPVITSSPSGVAALGASGGRRIISAVAQLTDRFHRGEDLQSAIESPRLHVEGDEVFVRADQERLLRRLRERGLSARGVVEEPTTWHFGRPNGLARRGARGTAWRSGVDTYKPFGVATV